MQFDASDGTYGYGYLYSEYRKEFFIGFLPEDTVIGSQEFHRDNRVWKVKYTGVALRCAGCQTRFVFSAAEQLYWFETRRFHYRSFATHCVVCRFKRRRLKKWEMELERALRNAAPADEIAELVFHLLRNGHSFEQRYTAKLRGIVKRSTTKYAAFALSRLRL